MTSLQKNFVRIDLDGFNGQGLLAIQHDPSDTPTHGARAPHGYTAYRDPAGVFSAGVWACDAGTLQIRDLAIDEACYLVEGEVIITDENGFAERSRLAARAARAPGSLLQRARSHRIDYRYFTPYH